MLVVKFLLLIALVELVASYRILIVWPLPTPSHQRPQQAISRALADAGHEVVTITPNPVLPLIQPNLTQIDASFLYNVTINLSNMAATEKSVWGTLDFCSLNINGLTDFLLGHDVIQNLLSSDRSRFDAIIVENLGFASIHQLAFEFKGAALIGVTSLEMWPNGHEHMGNPNHFLLHPSVFWPSLRLDELNLIERFKHFIDFVRYKIWYSKHLNEQDRILKKHFPRARFSAAQLADMFDFAIECVSPVLGYVRPLLPNTKQIPFLHIEPVKPLPRDLENYLNASTRGVVYISFGSTVKGVDMGERMLRTLTTALGGINYDVLWKYETLDMPNKPKNAKISTWTPQPDLLAHKNVKLFITQGGLQSMDEAISRGVPMLTIPFFADQDKNAYIVEELGAGKKLFRHEVTVKRLQDTIQELIDNPKYKRRVEQLRHQAWDMPMSPKEAAVWWIEYAIRNRGAHYLKYKGRDMPFYQYWALDIMAIALMFLWMALKVAKVFFQIFKSESVTVQAKNKAKKE